jgi:hypothetical protein
MPTPRLVAGARWLLAGAAAAPLLTTSGTAFAAAADSGKGGSGSGKQPQGPLFDPEALERGAKALREINASPHAKQVRFVHDVFALFCVLQATPHCFRFVSLNHPPNQQPTNNQNNDL